MNDEIYNAYFGIKPEEKEEKVTIDKSKLNHAIYSSVTDKRFHDTSSSLGIEYNVAKLRQMADGNISSIEQLADILKKLCNAAWGEGWGEFSMDLKKGENSSVVILPQITIETNLREVDEALGGYKPKLTDIIEELDDNGNPTGDAFLIYRQWFASNVEFNIYGRNSKESRDLMKRFENLLTVYTGYLKKHGISELWFESETHPKCSLNYDESAFMHCIYYYIRFEAITPIRQSVINRINTEIGVNQLNTQKVKTLIEQNRSELIDLEFFAGDNGITFNKS